MSSRIPIAILISGIIVASALYVSMPKIAELTGGDPSLVRPISASDHILGNPSARVMIIEYSDFDCDYCKSFHSTLEQIIANEGIRGDVAWVFRQFPLFEIHPNALSHARASECIASTEGNEAFWKFSKALYDNQPIDPSRYGIAAASSGISSDAFATCYSKQSPEIDARIIADRDNALEIGAHGTPYSLIISKGGRPIVMEGAYSYEAVRELLDTILAN